MENLPEELPNGEKTLLNNYLKEKYREYYRKGGETELKELFEIWDKFILKEEEKTLAKFRKEAMENVETEYYLARGIYIADGITPAVISKFLPNSIIMAGKVSIKYIGEIFPSLDLSKANRTFVISDLNVRTLKEMIDYAKKDEIKVIIGIGGGRIIDPLKFVSFITKKPIIGIPTSLTTHVYASPKTNAGDAMVKFGFKKTIDGDPPTIAIVDKKLILPLQKRNSRLITSGIGDVIAFISAIEDWKLAEKYGKDKTKKVVIEIADDIITKISKLDIKKPLETWLKDFCLIQVTLCNITKWVGSPPAASSEHLFAKAIEKKNKKPLHGELVALGVLISTYLQKKNVLKAQKIIKHICLPISLTEVGISVDEAVDALYRAREDGRQKDRFSILEIKKLSREHCGKIIDELLKKGIIKQ